MYLLYILISRNLDTDGLCTAKVCVDPSRQSDFVREKESSGPFCGHDSKPLGVSFASHKGSFLVGV
jgi:hypothetical protein